jgi:hypothetical protein
MIYMYRILNHLFNDKSVEISIYILLFFFLSPFILRYSSSVMSEPLALLFITGFFYYYLLYTENHKEKYFLLLIFSGCCAINSRFPSVVVVMLPLSHALLIFLKNFRMKAALFSIVIAGLVFLPNILFNPHDPGSFLEHRFAAEWSVRNFFLNSFSTVDGNLTYLVPNLLFVWGNIVYPGFIFVGIFMIFLITRSWSRPIYIFLIILSIILYALFIAGLPFQNQRFLLLTFPLILIVFSDGFFRISQFISKWKPFFFKSTVGLILVIQSGLSYRALKPFYENSRDARVVSDRMRNYPGRTIYTFNIDMALSAYEIHNKTINLWIHPIKNFQSGALVLINRENIIQQWQGMNPMINWVRLQKENRVHLIETMRGGWELYEITD